MLRLNAGLPTSIVDVLQRRGRVGHQDGSKGLFVVFYEPWVQMVSLGEFNNSNSDDPDQPRALVKPTSFKKDQAPFACVQAVQHKECLRKHIWMTQHQMVSENIVYCYAKLRK